MPTQYQEKEKTRNFKPSQNQGLGKGSFQGYRLDGTPKRDDPVREREDVKQPQKKKNGGQKTFQGLKS